jgi:predicted phage terminase large subunit-like protein
MLQRLTPEQLRVATPDEVAEYEHALTIELALSSPLDYANHVSTATSEPPHIKLLNRLIVLATRGELLHPETGEAVRKLAVSMPPRHGKSYLISDHTPPWAVTKWAKYGFNVGLAGYEADFAADWGRKARQHVLDFQTDFEVQVDNTTRAADNWKLKPATKGAPVGGMATAGVGGPFTGKGFHLIIVDDPIKNSEWAMSETIRNKQYEWLGSTAMTRLEPAIHTDERAPHGYKGAPDDCDFCDKHGLTPSDWIHVGRTVILVNTRWHEDDLMGRVTSKEPDAWYHLNLKAISDESAPDSDPIRRHPGAALWPQRFSISYLLDLQSSPTTGGYWFAAMYQGEPNIEGGGIFKRSSFRYHRTPPNSPDTYELLSPTGAPIYVPKSKTIRFSTADLAVTNKQTSDWSVISTWDVTPSRDLILVDRRRRRLESADHDEFVTSAFSELNPRWMGVEKTAYHLGLITRLLRNGLPIRPLDPDKDKVSRAIPAGIITDAGRVYFPSADTANWLEEWELELLAFPNSTHDDQVDTFSYAAQEVFIGALSNPVKDKPPVEDRSMEARRARKEAESDRPRRKRRHPVMGRW